MGKKSPKVPTAPDYTAIAKNQAVVNNPNVYTPFGSQTVTYDANGVPTVRQNLTGAGQATLENQQNADVLASGAAQNLAGQLSGQYSNPFQYSGPGVQFSAGDLGPVQKSVDLAQYGLAQSDINRGDIQSGIDTSNFAQMPVNAGMTGQEAILNRLSPQLERQRNAQTQQLANQGITSGSEAWRNAQTDLGQRENDLLSQAALQGINLDMAARQQQLGEELGLGNFYNQAQQQDYAQQFGAQGLYNQALAANQAAELSAGQFANQAQNQFANQALQQQQLANAAQQQAYNQQFNTYNQPLNTYQALKSGSQVNVPQFQQYQGANLLGAAQSQYQNAMDVYNSQVNSNNALTSGLFGLGGAVLGGAMGSPLGFMGAFTGKR